MCNLTSNNCGCGSNMLSGNGSCTWIILLLLFCGGCGNNGSGLFGGCGENSCCDWLIWILLLSCICGKDNGSSCGNNNSCNPCGC